MAWRRAAAGHFEVGYSSDADMDPTQQAKLLEAMVAELAAMPVSVLFTVDTMSVPRAVPEFWLGVTKKHAPKLCAMAIVSDSLAVRTAASGFSVANKMRGVALQVKAFPKAELEQARTWCRDARVRVTS